MIADGAPAAVLQVAPADFRERGGVGALHTHPGRVALQFRMSMAGRPVSNTLVRGP